MKSLGTALSTLLILMLAPAGTTPVAAKDAKKQEQQRAHDLSVRFLSEEPLIAVTWRGGRQYLTYPSLEPGEHKPSDQERRFRSIVDAHENDIRLYLVSRSREWLAVCYKKGPVEVTNLNSGETVLTISDHVSRIFDFHPTKSLFAIFQPEVGITQWDLDRGVRIEPTITGAKIGVTYLEISPNGNFIRTEGRCDEGKGVYDFCIFDLRDGSTVAWADDLGELSQLGVDKEDLALARDYEDLLAATGFVDPEEERERVRGCRRLPGDRLFCCSSYSVVLSDETGAPGDPEPPSSPNKAMGLLGIPKPTQTAKEFPGRYLWRISAHRERKKLFIDSCDLSADERWVVLGVNSSEVLLFDTERLEEASLALMGSWRQPVLVSTFGVP